MAEPVKIKVLHTSADIDPHLAEVLAAKQREAIARGCPVITDLTRSLAPGEALVGGGSGHIVFYGDAQALPRPGRADRDHP